MFKDLYEEQKSINQDITDTERLFPGEIGDKIPRFARKTSDWDLVAAGSNNPAPRLFFGNSNILK